MADRRRRANGRSRDEGDGDRDEPQNSLHAFLAEKARFEAIVAELQQMSADNFGADPEAVLWGVVARLQDWNSRLAQITDAYFRRGEFAA